MNDFPGEFERPLPLDEPDLIPPVVWLTGEGEEARLEWDWYPDHDQVQHPGTPPELELIAIPESRQRGYQWGEKKGLLSAFIRLADAPPEAFLSFAERFGPLMLCVHGLPLTHSEQCGPTRSEPLAVWRQFAQQTRALVQIANALHNSEEVSRIDWAAIETLLPLLELSADIPRTVERGRQAVTRLVNYWLLLGGVNLLFWWEGETPQVSLDGYGSFGTMATQLTFEIAKSSGIAVCSACGQPYFPERKPARGKRNYCQRCRAEGKNQRHAKREYWRRKYAKRTPEEKKNER